MTPIRRKVSEPFLKMINDLTEGNLTISDHLKYVYIFPENMRDKNRERILRQRGYAFDYLPLSGEDAKTIFNSAVELLKEAPERATLAPRTFTGSGFRAKSKK